MAWSSGKDSALALARLAEDPEFKVVGLLTTAVTEPVTVPLHQVPIELVEAQAAALELPLHVIALDSRGSPPYRAYRTALDTAVDEGVEAVAFGDIHLPWVRRRRETAMAATPIDCVFPLWGEPTIRLAHEIVDRGIRAIVTCIDRSTVPDEALGRDFGHDLLEALPPDVDRCGERGEFHTFVVAHPNYIAPLRIDAGPATREGRYAAIHLKSRTSGVQTAAV